MKVNMVISIDRHLEEHKTHFVGVISYYIIIVGGH